VIIQAVLFVHFLLPAQIAASPNPEAARLLQSAADAESHGNLDQAIADLRKAVDLDPSSAIALLKLGDAYFRKQDYGAATQPLQRAAELSPDSLPGPLAAQAYLLLAGIHRRQGESQLAAHDMEEYKRIHSAIDGVK
jgi:tetratricopeptide (TPR) repeat protein